MTTKLIIPSSGTIDLYEDIPFSLNYNIVDITQPDKRKSDYSKTIRVPGTENNNRIFMHIYEISMENQFNPNKKAEAIVMTDEYELMRGWMQLTAINNLDNKKIEYELLLYGSIANLFYKLGNNKVSELDLSSLNHAWHKTNILNFLSLFNAGTIDYAYPFIDRGLSADKINYCVENFLPCFRIKYLFDKILTWAGFTYTSTAINSGTFKRYTGLSTARPSIINTTIQNNSVNALLTADITVSIPKSEGYHQGPVIVFDNDNVFPAYDAGNIYNAATGITTIGTTGFYSISAFITAQHHYIDLAPVGGSAKYHMLSEFIIYKIDSNNIQTFIGGGYYGYSNMLYAGNYDDFYTPAQTINIANQKVYLQTGEQVKIVNINRLTYPGNIPTDTYYDYATIIKTNSYFEIKLLAEATVGTTLTGAMIVPQNMTMAEFIKSVLLANNMFIQVDKDNPLHLHIERREQYYNSTVNNWTDKLDVSRDLIFRPMGALDAARYIFRHRRGNDFLNEYYQDKYNEVYGQRKIDTYNDFLQNESVIETIFTPTPLYRSALSERYYSYIFKHENGVEKPYEGESLRILYIGYSRTSAWNMWDYPGGSATPGNTVTAQTTYNYGGHLDDPVAPTIDTNWGIPREVYYMPEANATYTNGNFFNYSWKNYIDEITDVNSKIVTGWFYLNHADIAALDFRNLYYFAGEYFRLLKVYDFNPINPGLTKCDFFKVKYLPAFTSGSATLWGGRGNVSTDTGYDYPTVITLTGIITSTKNRGDDPETGNNESARQSLNQSENNFIGQGCKNISLLASSGNIIYPGMENISLINTSGMTITESNVMYVNGFKVTTEKRNVRKTTTDTNATYNDCVFIGDTTTGDIKIYLPKADWYREYSMNGFTYKFVKLSASNQLLVYSSGTDNINGKDFEQLLTLRSSLTIISDGIDSWYTIT